VKNDSALLCSDTRPTKLGFKNLNNFFIAALPSRSQCRVNHQRDEDSHGACRMLIAHDWFALFAQA
jgi:hypothetical protein